MLPEDVISVRAATAADATAIVAFNIKLAWESENLRLDPATVQAGVQRALASPALCRYYIAERQGVPIGQCMLTFEFSDWRDGIIYWLQSVYVSSGARGLGAFRKLYGHIMDTARAAGDVRLVRLYVDKSNIDAIATYERLGMKRAHYHQYEAAL